MRIGLGTELELEPGAVAVGLTPARLLVLTGLLWFDIDADADIGRRGLLGCRMLCLIAEVMALVSAATREVLATWAFTEVTGTSARPRVCAIIVDTRSSVMVSRCSRMDIVRVIMSNYTQHTS
jgi:hypothetical protein